MPNIIIHLLSNNTDTPLAARADEATALPRLALPGETFLGWNRYPSLHYGFMNVLAHTDLTLHAISASGPAYVLESHFRGDPDNYEGPRCQFRRYVVDIYLENACAASGRLKLQLNSNILYYLGSIPEDGITLSIADSTNLRGHAYVDAACFTTADVTVSWQSEEPLDVRPARRKIARLMFAFSRWGMGYSEIARRTSDDILTPAYEFPALAGTDTALVSANFYGGVMPEQTHPSVADDPAYRKLSSPAEAPNGGEVLARFAVLSDSHVGVRYNWPDYDWLYGVYDHLATIHQENPLDFVLQLGDNIDDGYEATWQRDYTLYLDTVKRLTICDAEHPIEGRAPGKIPHYEMQGNHDTSMDTRFFRRKLWFAENAHGQKTAYIAFFTNYGGYPAVNFHVAGDYRSYRSYGVLTDDEVAFVEESILEAGRQNARHIVLLNHFGIAQDLVAPILPESGLGKIDALCRKYGIRLYLNGHEHNAPYTLRKYHALYDWDAAMTHDAYAVFELRERRLIAAIYRTEDHALVRADSIDLTV